MESGDLLHVKRCVKQDHLTPKQLARLRRLATGNMKAIPNLFTVALLNMYDQVVHERNILQMHLQAREAVEKKPKRFIRDE